MYKIVTETKEVYIYSNEIVSITYVNIAGTELLEVLHEAAKNRFGKGNYYINKLLAIGNILQAESILHKYESNDVKLPKYLRVVWDDDNEISITNKPKDLIGAA